MDNGAKKNLLLNAGVAVTTVAVVWIISRLMLRFLLPFVVAAILAYLLQRPAGRLAKRLKVKTKTAAVTLTLVTYLFLGALIFLVVWRLIVQSIDFSQLIINRIKENPKAFSLLGERLGAALNTLPDEISKSIISSIENLFEEAIKFLGSFASKSAAQLIKKTPQILFCTAVTVVASCYIAGDYERLKNFICAVIEKRRWERIQKIKAILVDSVLKIAWGYIKLSAITFVELTVGLLLLKIKYAPLIAFLIALVDLLPVLGCGTVLLPWAVVCFLTGNFYRGTALCIIYILILVVRYYLEPRIIGKGVGINPLFILLAMFLGFGLGSVGGMLIFPVVLIVVVNYYKRQLEEERGIITP